MINVTDAFKEKFNEGGQKLLTLTFNNGTVITNDDIVEESLEIEQILCDESQIVYGKCNSSKFKVKIVSNSVSLKGKTVNVKLSAGTHEIGLGTYKIDSETKTADKQFKELIGYDSLFDMNNRDVSSWYNGLSFPITFKNMRDSFFSHIGITQETKTLPCDNVTLPKKTIDADFISALTIMESICEINACFGCIGYDGKFKYIHIRNADDALFPSETLYPSNSLYPQDNIDVTMNRSDYSLGDIKYEDYTCKTITKIQIRETDDEQGVVVGSDGNTYVITGNPFCIGLDSTKLTQIATAFLSDAEYIPYTPTEIKTSGKPWIEIGDFIKVVTKDDVIVFPILKRVLSGINALFDKYYAKGNEYFETDMNNVSRRIENLEGKSYKLETSVDGLTSEVSKKVDGTTVSSMITQSADSIRLKSSNLVVDSTNFKLDSSGNMECVNGKFSGKIESSSGKIGGFTIETEGITKKEYLNDPTTLQPTGEYYETSINDGGVFNRYYKNNGTLMTAKLSQGKLSATEGQIDTLTTKDYNGNYRTPITNKTTNKISIEYYGDNLIGVFANGSFIGYLEPTKG